MNHVTRGLGARSGMLATGGLGRRLLRGVELVTQHIAAASRTWMANVESRQWSGFGMDRVWAGIGGARGWVIATNTRSWTHIASTRSWLVRKIRVWTGKADRSWSDDA